MKICCTTYNRKDDAMELWIKSEKKNAKWKMSCSCKCVEYKNRKEFIHYSFVCELIECINLGYKYIGFISIDELYDN